MVIAENVYARLGVIIVCEKRNLARFNWQQRQWHLWPYSVTLTNVSHCAAQGIKSRLKLVLNTRSSYWPKSTGKLPISMKIKHETQSKEFLH
jgi:hypothetical protein